MKDVRIVIVSWNVEKLLERNVLALPKACEGLDWECIVVDNASADGSRGLVERLMLDIPQLGLIANANNDGFSKACNKGAEGSEARYVLFLNPDTECPPGSLTKLVRLADERPKAGIFGPKLHNADGSVQPSVRTFPTLWDQVGILLKLHHVLRGLPMFRRYFVDDFDHEKEQQVDQVMGACFLVRKALLDAKLGFDERYFVWMEEVDFCLTAKRAGWEVIYLPQVSVIHHRGQSFAQVFTPKKQGYFTASVGKYFAKWYPGPQAWAIRVASAIGLALSYLVGLMQTSWGPWAVLVGATLLISRLTIFHPLANSIAWVMAVAAMFVVSVRKPHLGLTVLAVELLIGSKGYLLQFGGWPSHLSLRLGLTAAFLLAWTVNALNARRLGWAVDRTLRRTPYLALAVLVLWGMWRGAGNPDMLADANAWFELVLLAPVLDIADRHGDALRRSMVSALLVGIVALAILTLKLELLFSHQVPGVIATYLWLRRAGLGEVTRLAGSFYRVFLQSQVFLLAAWLIAAAYGLRKDAKPARYYLDRWIIALSTAGLFLGMSRSFVIGGLAGIITLALLASRQGDMRAKPALRIFLASAYGLILAATAVFLPIPGVSWVAPGDLLDSRLNDAAAQSRWELLPAMWDKISQAPILGHGFGATVTYHTFDPRQVEQGNALSYTTYAFEWGWLEHWIKFGLLGIPVMLWVLLSLGKRLWTSREENWLRIGAVASLVALAGLHMFTPYLNHPLGFLFLLVGEGMMVSTPKKDRI